MSRSEVTGALDDYFSELLGPAVDSSNVTADAPFGADPSLARNTKQAGTESAPKGSAGLHSSVQPELSLGKVEAQKTDEITTPQRLSAPLKVKPTVKSKTLDREAVLTRQKVEKLLQTVPLALEPTPPITQEMTDPQVEAKSTGEPLELDATVGETGNFKEADITASNEQGFLGDQSFLGAETDESEASPENINHMGFVTQWGSNGRPLWAQEHFDVLLFKVGGLTLSVPLICLGQIQPLANVDELTPLFGRADWFMGIQSTPAGNINTINTAMFVMPERYSEDFIAAAKYVISIDGVPWGLAVDSVHQPISVIPEQVQWRTDRTSRAWLAGTIKEHMCALIDIPAMAEMLLDADKSR